MRLYVDTQKVTFTVTRNPEPKNDQNAHRATDPGRCRRTKCTGPGTYQ